MDWPNYEYKPENFHRWQNDQKEADRARIKAANERLIAHQERAVSLDPSVLVLTAYDKKMLKGMKVAA